MKPLRILEQVYASCFPLQLGSFRTILLLCLFLEHPSQNLPTWILGHLINEPDTAAQLLVRRNLTSNPINQLFGLLISPWHSGVHDNVGTRDLLGSLLVKSRDNASIGDLAVSKKNAFQLCWGNLEALCERGK